MKLRLPSKLVAAILATASPVMYTTLPTATIGAAAVAVMAGQQAAADVSITENTTWDSGTADIPASGNVSVNGNSAFLTITTDVGSAQQPLNEFELKNGGDVTISGEGTDVYVTRMLLHNADTRNYPAYSEVLTIESGATLNVTKNSTATGYQNSALLIGHWPGGSKDKVQLLVNEGGALNVLSGWTHMSRDSGGSLIIQGGTANLKGIEYDNERTHESVVALTSGTLNIGSLGITDRHSSVEANHKLELSGGTLGTLDSDWTLNNVTLTLGGDAALSTEKVSDHTGARVTINSDIAKASGIGSATLTKTGAGELNLTSMTLGEGVTLNVSKGTLVYGEGVTNSGTINIGGSATVNVMTTVSSYTDARYGTTEESASADGNGFRYFQHKLYDSLNLEEGATLQINGTETQYEMSDDGVVVDTGSYHKENDVYHVNSGTVNYADTTAAGASGVYVHSSGTLNRGSVGSGTINLADISGDGVLSVALAGTTSAQNLAATLTLADDFTGTLSFSGNLSSKTNLKNIGSLYMQNGANLLTPDSSSSLTVNITKNITVADGTAESPAHVAISAWGNADTSAQTNISGILTGGNNTTLWKEDGGIITLSGNNKDFKGKIVINKGTLKVGNNHALGALANTTRTITVNTLGTLDIGGTEGDTSAYSITLNGGKLTNTGSTVGSGSRQLVTGITLSANSTLEVQNNKNFGLIANGYNGTTLDLNNYTLNKTGAGTYFITNATVSGTGKLKLTGGTLHFNATGVGEENYGSFASNIELAGGALQGSIKLGGASTITAVGEARSSTANVLLNGQTLGIGGDADLTLSGSISGTGSVVKTGTDTVTLSANNTATASLTVNEGTLKLAGAWGNYDNISVNKQAGKTAEIILSHADSAATVLQKATGNGDVTLLTNALLEGGNTPETAAQTQMTGTLTVGSGSGSQVTLRLGDSREDGGEFQNHYANLSSFSSVVLDKGKVWFRGTTVADTTPIRNLTVTENGGEIYIHDTQAPDSPAFRLGGLTTVNGTLTLAGKWKHNLEIEKLTGADGTVNITSGNDNHNITIKALQDTLGTLSIGNNLTVNLQASSGTIKNTTLGTGTLNISSTATLSELTINGGTVNLTQGGAKNTQSLGDVTINGGTIKNTAGAESMVRNIKSLAVGGDATLAQESWNTFWNIGALNKVGETSAEHTLTWNMTTTHFSNSVLSLTGEGDFDGTFHANRTNKPSTNGYYQAQVEIADQNALKNAVLNATGAGESYMTVALNADKVNLAGLQGNAMSILMAGAANKTTGSNTESGKQGNIIPVSSRTSELVINSKDEAEDEFAGKVLGGISITKKGTGTQKFSGNVNDFNGTLAVNNGTMSFSALTPHAATENINNLHISTATVSGSGALQAGAATLKANPAPVTQAADEGTPGLTEGSLTNATFTADSLTGKLDDGSTDNGSTDNGTLVNALLTLQENTTYSISDMDLLNSVINAEAATKLALQNVNVNGGSSVSAVAGSTLSGQNYLTLSATEETATASTSSQLSGLTLQGSDGDNTLAINLGNVSSMGLNAESPYSITLRDFKWQDLIGEGAPESITDVTLLNKVFAVNALVGAADSSDPVPLRVVNAHMVGQDLQLDVVPEPTTGALSLLALTALAARRRRK